VPDTFGGRPAHRQKGLPATASKNSRAALQWRPFPSTQIPETVMSLSMYQATVPPFRSMLKNLQAVMAKAEAHCEARKIEPAAFLNSRLYPDMLPFTSQVQIASDNVKGAAGRLSGAEIPKFEDTEKSFPELQARIDKTIAFLDTLTEAQFEGADQRDIVLQLRDRKLDFKGADYLTLWAIPNIYFHITTAYALLRHGGVEIGKKDYLSGGAAQGK
jgi:uncharacterized protein